MDNLNYTYLNIAGAPSNRLGHVDDPIAAINFTDDQQEQIANIEGNMRVNAHYKQLYYELEHLRT